MTEDYPSFKTGMQIRIFHTDLQTFYLQVYYKSINGHAKSILDLLLCQVSN